MTANPHQVKAQSAGASRRETFEGREHLVVPVVLIVEGVLNGAFVPAEEFSKFADAWNGRPVPVYHPEEDGLPISANRPDVLEARSVGHLFHAKVEGRKLKAEAWIDVQKAEDMGEGDLVRRLEAGEIMEVSTGYFADGEPQQGIADGQRYEEIHRNIRPDHLALLPDQVGACSVADGCGVRANSEGWVMKTRDALQVLAGALGFRVHDDDNGGDKMPNKTELIERAKGLRANERLSSEQMDMLMQIGEDPQQLAMAKALLDAVEAAPAGEPEPMEDDEIKDYEGEGMSDAPAVNAGVDPAKLDELVAHRVDQAIRRRTVTAKLAANSQCPFTEAEMAEMPVAHLEKLEESIRPVDYSGQGGFVPNSHEGVEPLTVNRGLMSRNQEQ